MLTIRIPGEEYYDDSSWTFVRNKETTLQLEHSLVSLAKWESIHNKPFLHTDKLTRQETLDYIRCMTITQNTDPAVYDRIPQTTLDQIRQYMDKRATATTFSRIADGGSGGAKPQIVTAEIIYYWMFTFGIPMECQKWHLNRLMDQIKVCSIRSGPGKKMPKHEAARQQRELNAARKRKHGTRG